MRIPMCGVRRHRVLLLLMIGYSSMLAQNSTARFLLSTPSARSMALGGTGTAYTYDAMTPFTNPAGICFVHPWDITASFLEPNPFEENRKYVSFSGVFLQGRYGTVALSFNNYALGTQSYTGEDSPELLGVDKSLARIYRFSYAYLTNEHFSAGMTLNYFDYSLSEIEISIGGKRGKPESQSMFFNLGFLYSHVLPASTFRPDHISVPGWIEGITRYTARQGLSAGSWK